MGKKVRRNPLVRPEDEDIVRRVSQVILEEKIDSSEKLRERFSGDVAANAAIFRNAKVVAASLALIKTGNAPVSPSLGRR